MDFGKEPPSITKLFKSDYGQEPKIWEELTKGTLTETIAAKQGTTGSVPSTTSTTPTPTTPHVGGLANRMRAVQEKTNHPAVQQATARLNNQGIQVEDKMPNHYTPEMRAKAISNVANGVEFMHRQFPGMDQLSRNHGMRYTLQGPQVMGGGQLMGQYHPPGSKHNPGYNPKIELNGTAEHTLWHEHAHFLDHAAAGMGTRATATENHPLRAFSQELQNHPIRQAAQRAEAQAAMQSGDPEAINHALYRNQEDEVMARWFNSHMNYLHGIEGEGPTSEPYDPEYNEGWTPEHHEELGAKFRNILRQYQMTRSFAEYLDRLHKAGEGVGSWSGSGEFHTDSVKPAAPSKPTSIPTTPSPITPDVPQHVGEATGRLHDELAHEYATRSDPYRSMGDKSEAHHGIATHMLENNPVSLEDHIQARIAMRPGSSYNRLHEHLSGLSDLDRHKDLLSTFDDHWIGSVNSNEPEHVIANRVNAGRVFGLNSWEKKPDYITNLAWKKGMRLADDPHFQKAHSAYLKSMYAHTQNELAKRGLNSVALIRGVHKIADPDVMNSIREQYKDGDLATGHMDTNLAPLSSFTLSPKVASDYGGITPQYGQSSATLNMVGHVPASRILSLWNTGYGYGDHHEVVALGGPARMHWATHSYDGDVMKDWLHKKQRGLIKSMNIPTVNIDDSAENLEWLQPPEIKKKYHDKGVTKSFSEHLDRLSKSLPSTPEELPELPEGQVRVVHLTNPENIPHIQQHGLNYESQGMISSTARAYSQAHEAQYHTDDPRFKGAHAVVMHMPFHEYRLHNDVARSPGVVHPSRIVGVVKPKNSYQLNKALEETRQGRPLPGTQRATRMPQGYKVPRKITRPGVRGSTLWWYDEKGNVRYGPKPVQKGPPKDEPQHVKDYLQSERPWSFMSAYSESRPTDQNDQLHSQLGKELQANPDYEVYPSRGYYTDEQSQLREEPSYLVIGMTTKSALPLGQKYGQDTVLTHHGMFDVNQRTLAPIRYKRVEGYDLPKDIPQTVVLTKPNHVTIVIQTGQPVPFGSSA